MSVDRFLTGMVAFAGGIVAGVLLAPQSGAATRDQLSDEARAQFRKMEGQLESLEGKLSDVTSHLREASGDMSNRVRHAAADQVLPDLPEDPEAFKIADDEIASDLRHLPRK